MLSHPKLALRSLSALTDTGKAIESTGIDLRYIPSGMPSTSASSQGTQMPYQRSFQAPSPSILKTSTQGFDDQGYLSDRLDFPLPAPQASFATIPWLQGDVLNDDDGSCDYREMSPEWLFDHAARFFSVRSYWPMNSDTGPADLAAELSDQDMSRSVERCSHDGNHIGRPDVTQSDPLEAHAADFVLHSPSPRRDRADIVDTGLDTFHTVRPPQINSSPGCGCTHGWGCEAEPTTSSEVEESVTPSSEIGLHQTNGRDDLILTLDGGGIRGYSSLLVLKQLMNRIADHEKRFQSEHELPYHKLGWVANALEPLPCHYFDYMYGTNTGGLISTMLSRMRMTVPQCLEIYKDMSQKIFGDRRLLHDGGPGTEWAGGRVRSSSPYSSWSWGGWDPNNAISHFHDIAAARPHQPRVRTIYDKDRVRSWTSPLLSRSQKHFRRIIAGDEPSSHPRRQCLNK